MIRLGVRANNALERTRHTAPRRSGPALGAGQHWVLNDRDNK